MAKRKQRRYEVLKAMNTIVKNLNNEDGYDYWCYTIPDCADDDELLEIAFDDEDTFIEAVDSFKRIMKSCLEDGLYIAGKLY